MLDAINFWRIGNFAGLRGSCSLLQPDSSALGLATLLCASFNKPTLLCASLNKAPKRSTFSADPGASEARHARLAYRRRGRQRRHYQRPLRLWLAGRGTAYDCDEYSSYLRDAFLCLFDHTLRTTIVCHTTLTTMLGNLKAPLSGGGSAAAVAPSKELTLRLPSGQQLPGTPITQVQNS